MSSSRPRRCVAVSGGRRAAVRRGALMPAPPSGTCSSSGWPPPCRREDRTAERRPHPVDELGRRHGDGVRAERDDVALGRAAAVGHLDLGPPLVELGRALRVPAQRVAAAVPHPHDGGALGLGQLRLEGHLGHVVGRDGIRPRPALATDGALEPAQPEGALVATVDVEARDVPAAVPVLQRPRLHVAGRQLAVVLAVVEGDRLQGRHRGVHGLEGRLLGADPRLGAGGHRLVDLDAREPQLAQARGRGARDARRRPRAGGQRQGGDLVGLEADGRQRGLARLDAIADLVVEEDVEDRRRDGDAHLAQLVLVTLEHPVERLVGGRRGVGRQRLADLLLRDRSPRGLQREDEVEQPFGLVGRGRRRAHRDLPEGARRMGAVRRYPNMRSNRVTP